MRMKILPIGFVRNKYNVCPGDYRKALKETSTITVLPKYAKGLYRIKEHKEIEVIFYFHKSKGYELKCRTPRWGIKGVFACRSPYRPAPLGLTRARLISVRKNELIVKGLDAVNGTPVLDIKPYVNFLKPEKEIRRHERRKRPEKGNKRIIG